MRVSAGKGWGCLVEEFADTLNDKPCLRLREFRVNWQRERFFRRPLTLGERAGRMPEIGEAFLQVHGHRVVHLRAYAFLPKIGLQFIAARNTDDVLIEDVAVGHHGGKANRQAEPRRKS